MSNIIEDNIRKYNFKDLEIDIDLPILPKFDDFLKDNFPDINEYVNKIAKNMDGFKKNIPNSEWEWINDRLSKAHNKYVDLLKNTVRNWIYNIFDLCHYCRIAELYNVPNDDRTNEVYWKRIRYELGENYRFSGKNDHTLWKSIDLLRNEIYDKWYRWIPYLFRDIFNTLKNTIDKEETYSRYKHNAYIPDAFGNPPKWMKNQLQENHNFYDKIFQDEFKIKLESFFKEVGEEDMKKIQKEYERLTKYYIDKNDFTDFDLKILKNKGIRPPKFQKEIIMRFLDLYRKYHILTQVQKFYREYLLEKEKINQEEETKKNEDKLIEIDEEKILNQYNLCDGGDYIKEYISKTGENIVFILIGDEFRIKCYSKYYLLNQMNQKRDMFYFITQDPESVYLKICLDDFNLYLSNIDCNFIINSKHQIFYLKKIEVLPSFNQKYLKKIPSQILNEKEYPPNNCFDNKNLGFFSVYVCKGNNCFKF